MEHTVKISSFKRAQRTRHRHLKTSSSRVCDTGEDRCSECLRLCRLKVRDSNCQVAPERHGWTQAPCPGPVVPSSGFPTGSGLGRQTLQRSRG